MQRRRNRGLELGVVLLLSEMMNVGFRQIPTVTLCTIVGQVLLYLGIIQVPWEKWEICISAETILKHRDYKRLFFSTFEHGDDMHLYYNMISFMVKGRSLERRYGSTNFGFLLLMISVLTSVIYVGLGYTLTEVLHNSYYMRSCAIGFSGVIFALKVLTSYETPPGREFIGFLWVPTRYAAWFELILIHLLVPNTSFIGHFAGILAGLIYISTPIGSIMDGFISSLTGEPIIHYRNYY
ncbi:rhomboid-related protein 4 [Cryptotermes secundus]|uniref:rhomboid-related protein 4 n=1 Tax=Cryptotermes secundus TaxID=105785 RepID=UPI000CD7AEAA|nr:rhomboid-related protein 4 [Cryptotermes secundus]